MSDQIHKAVNFTCAASPGAGLNVVEITDDALHYDTWIFGSAAGSMDAQVSLDGTNYQTAVLAMLDMGSSTPSTMVVATTAGGNYAIRGKFRKLRLRQIGATGVTGAALIGYRTT